MHLYFRSLCFQVIYISGHFHERYQQKEQLNQWIYWFHGICAADWNLDMKAVMHGTWLTGMDKGYSCHGGKYQVILRPYRGGLLTFRRVGGTWGQKPESYSQEQIWRFQLTHHRITNQAFSFLFTIFNLCPSVRRYQPDPWSSSQSHNVCKHLHAPYFLD